MFPSLRALLPLPSAALAILLGLAVPAAVGGQEGNAESPVAGGRFGEQVDVRVVNVEVFVTDRKGDRISGLTRDDFELRVDGEPMPISNFYAEAGGRGREAVRPLERRSETEFTPIEQVTVSSERRAHVVVLIDHTRIRPANRKRAFEALRQAISTLGDEDLIAVVGIEGSLVFYSDFLYDRKAIGEILDEVDDVAAEVPLGEIQRREIFGLLARGQSGTFLARASTNIEGADVLNRIQVYATEEFDRSVRTLSQIEAVVSTMAGVEGRKALLYLGEGIPQRPGEGLWVEWRNRFGGFDENAEMGIRRVDFNNDYTRSVGRFDLSDRMQRAADIANRAGVTVYAIDAEGDHGAKLRSSLTEQGSTSESVSVVDENFRAPLEFTTRATGGKLLRSSGTLTEQLGDMLDDFDTFYSLGFVAPEGWDPGAEYDIDVKVDRRRVRVRHREKFRIPEPGEREASATVTALMYETVDNPLGIKATPGSEAPREDGTAALPILLEIPVGQLDLVPQGETHAVSVTLFVSIRDKDGNPGPVQRVPFHLNIPGDKVEEAKTRSAHYSLPIVLRPGDRQVAIGVRDDVSGRLSVLRLDVARFSQAL
ncbi:MAG: VWA domain-containing protein [Acidobacteriota bacterium]